LDGREIRIFCLKVRTYAGFSCAISSPAQHPPLLVTHAVLDNISEQAHIRAGTEPPARAGQHDHADVVVALGIFHRGADFVVHHRRPGIQFVGPVERDRGYVVPDFIQRFLVRHGR
jgi:hypothetical protein